jgi:hypothetical protein
VRLKGELKESISGYHSKHDGHRIFIFFSMIIPKNTSQSSKDAKESANRELVENLL